MAAGKSKPIDTQLLSRLLDEHGRALTLFARQYCDSPEDVVQYAFLKLVRSRQGHGNMVPWLYRVARNRAISIARSSTRRQRRELRVARREQPWFEPDYAEELDARAAADALKALPEPQREIIIAHIWGGLTFEQIGQVVGCSSSTAHRHYNEGLSSLRERLRSPCTEHTTTEN